MHLFPTASQPAGISVPVALLTLLLAAVTAAPAKTEIQNLRWSELSGAVAGREATVVLTNSIRLTGEVTGVRQDSLLMTVLKTSDKKAYAAGSASILRSDVAEIRLKMVKGPARLIGAAGGGAAGALGSFGWAISDSRVNVSDGARVAQWAAITAGATVAGYFIGRAIDTKQLVIKIAAEE